MIFQTNKEKGNTGLGMAIAYYTSQGHTVSIPLNDTQDYDLIVDKNDELKRVQVKATSCKNRGIYQVALKSCGGTKGSTYKTIIDTQVEEAFIFTGDGEMYIIPKEKITNKSTLSICDKYKDYKVEMK